jgi:hypothetical protein
MFAGDDVVAGMMSGMLWLVDTGELETALVAAAGHHLRRLQRSWTAATCRGALDAIAPIAAGAHHPWSAAPRMPGEPRPVARR